jgi:hypothetical protein
MGSGPRSRRGRATPCPLSRSWASAKARALGRGLTSGIGAPAYNKYTKIKPSLILVQY